MAADLREAAPQAANALIAHLRERPEDAKRNPTELAEKFGLSPFFVSSVLESAARTGVGADRRDSRRFRLAFDAPKRLVKRSRAFFERATVSPMPFVVWSTFACILVCQLLSLATVKVGAGGIASVVLSSAVLMAMFGTLSVHIACYSRQTMTRYALQGGLFVWVVLSVVFTVLVWREQVGSIHRNTDENSLLFRLLFLVFVTGAVASIYAGIGVLATILGGWVRMRNEQRQEEQMGRQELLERYFALEARLENSGEPDYEEPVWNQWAAVRLFRKHPRIASLVVGFLMGTPTGIFYALPTPSNTLSASAFFLLTLRGAFGLMAILSYVFIGFFSRDIPAAVSNALIGRAASFVNLAIPIEFRRNPDLRYLLVMFAAGSVAQVGAAWAAQIGARVQAGAQRSDSLRKNDQATIVAEMLRIQWRLADHQSIACVLVVDAARSSDMKANADPLAVEYSFREYLLWIDGICTALGGRVHSTAGDGAVVAFDDCASAFRAARRIQTDVSRFNQTVNRLSTPFRLRVGLHVGQIAGELDQVEFSEVIDIAAHTQAVAPVSGIAATDEVVMALEGEAFIPLAKKIDGHGVSLALNPTED